MATIAMPHFGFVGHTGPAIRLGGVLARQGHRVLAWGATDVRERIEQSGAEFRHHDPFRVRDHLASPQALAAAIAEEAERHAGALIEACFAEGVDLVVHDFHALWARVAADFLGLPRAVSHPLFPGTSENLHPFHPLDPSLADDPVVVGHLEVAVARVERSRRAILERWGVDVGRWYEALVSRAPATVCYSTAEITGIRDPGPGWRYVGALLDAPPEREDAGTQPRVYVSFGTVFNFAPGVYRTAIEALADGPYHVVLSTGRGPLAPQQLGPLPSNLEVHDYVHGREQLSRTDVFVTHAGCSSAHESLLAGVPMVCLPQGADQFAWSDRVAALGAGRVSAPEPAAIRATVQELLADPGFAARARNAGRLLAAAVGEDRVASLVAELLAERPPAPVES